MNVDDPDHMIPDYNGMRKVVNESHLDHAEIQLWHNGELFNSFRINPCKYDLFWVNDYRTNLQIISTHCFNAIKPYYWSHSFIKWDYTDCFEYYQDDKGIIPKWKDNCFMKRHHMTCVILKVTDHTFDDIFGLV